MMTLEERLRENIRIRNAHLREFLAEFLGTFILVAIGSGSVAQFVLGKGEYGSFLTVNWAWGLAVAMGVWVSGGVSGGHINPAVSLAFAILGRICWGKFFMYMAAQYLGAILASACVFGVYYDALVAFDNGTRAVGGELGTAGIWATYPQEYVSWGTGLGDQMFGTFLLMLLIMAITDENNMTPPKGMVPLCVGLVVAVIGMSFGINCGFAVNPARDLGPRIFTAIAGWGKEPFSFRGYNWFWVPVVGQHIGAICGAFIYLFLVGLHLPETEIYNVNEPDDFYDIKLKSKRQLVDPPVDYDNGGFDTSYTSSRF